MHFEKRLHILGIQNPREEEHLQHHPWGCLDCAHTPYNICCDFGNGTKKCHDRRECPSAVEPWKEQGNKLNSKTPCLLFLIPFNPFQ